MSLDNIQIMYLLPFFGNLLPFPHLLVVPISVSPSFSCMRLSSSFIVGMNINLCYNINLLAHSIDKFEYNTDAMSISLIYLFSIFCP